MFLLKTLTSASRFIRYRHHKTLGPEIHGGLLLFGWQLISRGRQKKKWSAPHSLELLRREKPSHRSRCGAVSGLLRWVFFFFLGFEAEGR
jgi:hypothetical protein